MARRLAADVERQAPAPGKWRFLLIGVVEHYAVCTFLQQHSRRPALAQRLWAFLFVHLDFHTGEVLVNRHEIAAELNVSAQVVSALMGELVKFGALTRLRAHEVTGTGSRSASFRMNEWIATTSGRGERDEARRKPLLKVIDGGRRRNERRSRAASAPVEAL